MKRKIGLGIGKHGTRHDAHATACEDKRKKFIAQPGEPKRGRQRSSKTRFELLPLLKFDLFGRTLDTNSGNTGARWSCSKVAGYPIRLWDSRYLIIRSIYAANPFTIAPRIRNQLGNHLGSAMLELDEFGAVISYEEYHPYGTSAYRAVDDSVEVSAQRYRYTDTERDEETGLYYHGARYYASWLARWTAADPAGMVDGVNLFQYVRGGRLGVA